MLKTNISDFYRGWVTGWHDSKIIKCTTEVGLQRYNAGDKHDIHCHKVATEVNIVVSGTVEFTEFKRCDVDHISKHNTIVLEENDILLIHPNEYYQFQSITDSCIVCVKHPSIANDKYIINEDAY